MKLAISFCSTKMYLHAAKQAVRRIISSASHKDDVTFILVTDDSKESSNFASWVKDELPKEWAPIHRKLHFDLDGIGEKYKVKSQLLIAAMQGEAFAIARKSGAAQLWNVEADVLVPPDCLRMLEWALQMPNADGSAYYDVAMATYPNGLFIGGFGDPHHAIAQDFLPSERLLPDDLKERYQKYQEEERNFISERKMPPDEWQKASADLHADINKCPLDGKNVFDVTGKHGYRRRGWLDNAYPGIGLGSLVPVDWIGTGCVLLSSKALALATFDGYSGTGTQDLFLCWGRWHPAGIRIAASTHAICDHVKHEIIDGKETGKYIHFQAKHEQVGEQRGHLRVVPVPWVPL
jgi:hypothetical protein